MKKTRYNIIPNKYIFSIVNLRDKENNKLLNCNTFLWLTGWDYSDESLDKHLKTIHGSREKLLNKIIKKYKLDV